MRRLRQFGALLALAVLLAGVPWLFAVTIGNPLHGWRDLSAGDLSSAVVIDILAAIVWIAWAQFTVSVLVETAAAVRGTRLPSRIPGVFGAQQQLARRLVTAVLLIGAVTAAFPVMPHALATPTPPRPPSTVSSVPAPIHSVAISPAHANSNPGDRSQTSPAVAAPQTTVYVVPHDGLGPDTLWDIAEARLGAGERWHEIWTLNKGRTQRDGTVMTDPGLLRPGWTVLVPRNGPPPDELVVRVVPEDTLTAIADEHDLSEARVWALNRGRTMSDGRLFTDPDLIKPGDTILVPVTPSPQTTSPRTPSTHTSPAPPAPHSTPAPTLPPPQPPQSSDPQSTSPAPDPTTTTSSTDPAATAAATRSPQAAEDVARPVVEYLLVLGGGAGLLAASLYAAMRRYRRRQLRHRPAGHTLAPTAPPLRPVDAAVQIAGAPAVSTVTTIDQALRALHRPDSKTASSLTSGLLRLTVDPDTVQLQFADQSIPDTPAPWKTTGDHVWQARRADLTRLVRAPGEAPAPCPTLVSAVHDGDRETLLHLAEFGVLVVTGDRERAANWLRFVTGELAHNSWSDHLTVTLAGLEPELVALNPARLAHTDDVPAAARALAATGESPEVLILGPGWHDDADSRTAIVSLLPALTDPARPRTGPVVIAFLPDEDTEHPVGTSTPPADVDPANGRPSGSTPPLRIDIDADGILTATDPHTGLDLSGPAAQLPAAHAAGIAARLAQMRSTDPTSFVPLPPLSPQEPEQPDESTTAGGAARPPETAQPEPDDPAPLDAAAAAGPRLVPADLTTADTTSLLTAPDLDYVTRTATTAADLQFLAPSIKLSVAASLDHDTGLDADLSAWRDSDSPRAKLALLGPVALTAHGRVPDGRIAFYTEVVTYLALHPRGVTGDRFAADLWPERELTGRDSSPKNALSVVRKWLGVDLMTGADYLPVAGTDGPGGVPSYRVSGLLVDWDLFRRLRTRAQVRGADGIADLIAALDLVTGEPLTHRRLDGYGWLRDGTTIDEDGLSVAIVDAAHTVATAALAAGDTTTAQHAVDIAVSVDPADDRPLLDQAAVLDAQGRRAELAATVRRIRAHHEAEVEEDLPPRTYEILLRHGWLAG